MPTERIFARTATAKDSGFDVIEQELSDGSLVYNVRQHGKSILDNCIELHCKNLKGSLLVAEVLNEYTLD